MTFILASGSADPLYRRVRRAIEDAVAAGSYHGRLLPSSRALASELGVSRTTVNLAYQELVTDGFIVSEPRVGYRINAELLERLEGGEGARALARSAHEGRPADANVTAAELLEATAPVDWAAHLHDRSSHRLPEIKKDYDWQRYPYPFIYGQVPTSSFPVTAWNRALRIAMEHPHLAFSLRDAGSSDDPLLVEHLCATVLPSRGIRARPDQVLVTAGAQHGLHLAAQALLHPGDVVAVENPGYPDVSHIVERVGGRPRPVDVDRQGLRVAEVPSEARVISVTPSHQFPTNVGLAVARRQQLLDHARAHDSFVLEDDYDSEFRYVGRPSPALRASGEERVIYVGSFSKFLAPGLRLGFVVAEEPLIEQMRGDRRYSVRHLPGHLQRAVALMLSSGDYQRALRRQRLRLRERWRLMNSYLTSQLGDDFEPPTGGTSMWVPLPAGVSSDEVAAVAARRGILVESGSTFYIENPSHAHEHLRLAYSAIPTDRIGPGLEALFGVVRSVR